MNCALRIVRISTDRRQRHEKDADGKKSKMNLGNSKQTGVAWGIVSSKSVVGEKVDWGSRRQKLK